MRNFNGNEIELLAPAGNLLILNELINSKSDAFYLGGKEFNMRMHRSNFNFSRQEIKDSIELAHEKGKKIYITVNNLMFNNEIAPCLDYLYYLEELSPDGLIIQDLAIISLIRDNNLSLPMHSSVMMNVHNLEMVKELSSLGVTRVVTSREIDLQTIKYWNSQSSMEFEYFIHGDMCSTHGSQCYYSTMLFGNSGNRGLCMKPCRWDYKIKYNGSFYNTEFPMAVKDMCMYQYIPELIYSGVNSFKIEGRMRESSYLHRIINAYGDTIDSFLEDPCFYDRDKHMEILYDSRNRDLSTSFAFGNPKLEFINRRYEGTGHFYSTGKVFSKPVQEHSIDDKHITNAKMALLKDTTLNNEASIPLLSVKCDTLAQVESAIVNEIDIIYISTENFRKDHKLSVASIINMSKIKGNSKLVLSLPKMTFDNDFYKYDALLNNNGLFNAIDGLMICNLGALAHYKDFNLPLYSDVTMNIGNTNTSKLYAEYGLKNIVLSLEMNLNNLKSYMDASENTNVEIVAHGSPSIMYMDLDLYEHIKVKKPAYPADNLYFENEVLVLVDDNGFEHPIYRDNHNKNHLLLYKDICLLPIHNELSTLGISILRLEIGHYNINDFEKVIKAYKKAISHPKDTLDIYHNLKPNHMDYSLGALYY
ncbi:U32 family peptidase [Alkalibaculum sp. M08DMB]|uniref:U32 family peptidase n=1 Tax=Alkalibaculum sporogenes TaxID=2655001 RepID=A0A6A7KBX6_9FIRM|nr:U32 family peptidase [Alkalibaculum sporogenes]MPW26896.1 U32 family peptidase [Alkalibaculum sporogenes]